MSTEEANPVPPLTLTKGVSGCELAFHPRYLAGVGARPRSSSRRPRHTGQGTQPERMPVPAPPLRVLHRRVDLAGRALHPCRPRAATYHPRGSQHGAGRIHSGANADGSLHASRVRRDVSRLASTQIKRCCPARRFDQRPVGVLLAVFPPFQSLEKHDLPATEQHSLCDKDDIRKRESNQVGRDYMAI